MKRGRLAAFQGAGCALLGIWLCFGSGCGSQASGAEVAFVLVAADSSRGGANPRDVLDRSNVVEVTCQVFIPKSSVNYQQTVPVDSAVDPLVQPQEVHLTGIKAGSGYFARILGLTADRSVFQCGANGPFGLEPGEREFVVIVIDRPPAGDSYCSNTCEGDADCPQGSVCPSPCAAGDTSQPCTPALCQPG